MSSNVLNRWGVIAVEGDDAVAFLQAQLSNDVAGMPNQALRLAALCNAKGRMLGSFFVIRRAEGVLLITRSDALEALVKRLSMFVLRSKCKVRNACAEYSVHWVANSPVGKPMAVQQGQSGMLQASLRALPSGHLPGFELQSANGEHGQATGNGADDEFEHALITLGLAFVCKANVEMFIPQAVNFDLVGGVSFSKGCYPGQEVVARSHYLGKLKRRAFLAHGQAAQSLEAGTDVWLEGKTNEPAGLVINSVQSGGRQHLLLELPVEDALEPGNKFFVQLDGQGPIALTLALPPYDVQQKGNQFEVA
ncbi:folate-binding protein YgfZ [Limnobacter sp.]|uniref:CAF17-like 4Fe-4S cluster assembly/insertion protein YgfZ n=1 Tax=Limnobacter sp. TaxID=2003368 RepID=UPI0035143AA7